MTYVVTKKCVGCKDTACAKVCPVDSFHEGPRQLFINPEVCIVCDGCVVECPVDAIYFLDDVPPEHESDIERNAEAATRLPVFIP